MSNLTILVVDDEPLARRRVIRVVASILGVTLCGEAGDAIEAEKMIHSLKPDILLLDVQMPGASGFDLLEQLGDAMPVTVLVTAFDHHALRAFDAHAIDYVTKPIHVGRLTAAIERARTIAIARRQDGQIAELSETVSSLRLALHRYQRGPNEFWVKVMGEHVRVPADAILRIQAERDYVRLHTESRSYLLHESMAKLERSLESHMFLRVHRSMIIRRDRIRHLRPAPFASLILQMDDGKEIRVGRTYAPMVRSLLLKRSSDG